MDLDWNDPDKDDRRGIIRGTAESDRRLEKEEESMTITVIIVGVVCAGVFALIGPLGIIVVGLMLALAGISAKKD